MAESVTAPRPGDVSLPVSTPPGEPLTNLRGAKHGLDTRRVGAVAAGLALVGLVVLIVALFVAGGDRNARITDLRAHGVDVKATVTQCRGQLGGSGSNPVGYVCSGTITVDGRSYSEVIPGSALHGTGDKVPLVMVAGNPRVIASPEQVATDRTSWRVFILPSVLLIVLLAGGGTLLSRRRRPTA